MKLAHLTVAALLLCSPAFAEKCRVVDTNTNYPLKWDNCKSIQSDAQWLADTLQSSDIAVEHRNWWGKKWRVKVSPNIILESAPEIELPQSKRPEMPVI